MSSSLWSQEMQHARLPCPSLCPWVCANTCLSSQGCHPTISSSVNGLKILSLGPLSDPKVHSYLTVKTVSKMWVPEKPQGVQFWKVHWRTNCLFVSFSHTLLRSVWHSVLTPSSDTRVCTLTFCLTHTYTQAFCHTLSIHSSSQIPCLTEDHAGPPASFLLSMPPSSHSKHECFITSRLSPSSQKERKKRARLMPEVLKEAGIQICQ